MIIEFVGMSGVGKSTLISKLKPMLLQKSKRKVSSNQTLSLLIFSMKLLLFLIKANFILNPINGKARLKVTERLLLSCLKHYKNQRKNDSYKIVDEGIIHAILFSIDNRVVGKEVDYMRLIRATRFLLELEEVVVVFVDAHEKDIVKNRQKRNRSYNEKTISLSLVEEERNRNARKLAILTESKDQLSYTYINYSGDLSEEDTVLAIVNTVMEKELAEV
ncbi:hypothetical protein N0O92_08815 [Alkalihalobacillus sp. MEB130]|uniref:hypothetical protein n=1 Tax=Alkalihalobacillus sp. MEB130 TaxID=2976704 RepID=UPI0028DF91C4|nr:hypothetical protein [Alkalihalobacillus sp. MEB130]MDT8860333.1 hypothetical protein [Alkalihalobacillus sp. MEB130]